MGLGAIGLTEIIRAGGAGSNLQSRANGERSRVCPSSKAEKTGGLIKSTNTSTQTHRTWNNSTNNTKPQKPGGTNAVAHAHMDSARA